MKKLLLLCIVLALMSWAFADTFVIGTGTAASGLYPTYGFNDYGWSKQIYTAAEINTAGLNEAGDISGFGLFVGNTPANYVMTDQRVYIRHTTLTGYSTVTDETGTGYPANTGFTQVFQGNLTFNGGGWHYFIFNTNFPWNNTDNIEILWENLDGSGLTGSPTFRYTSTTPDYRNVYKNQNTTFPTTAGTRTYNRSNLTIITPSTDPPNPATVLYPADGGWAFQNAILSWADGGGLPNAYSVYLDTVNPPVTMVSENQTGTTFTPTLAANTEYFWQVVPRNDNGQAENCPVWSFNTPSASQLVESFEVVTPFLPVGWDNPGTWSGSTTTPFHGSRSAFKSASTTPALLSTPMLDIVAGSTLDFYYRTASTTGYGRLQVKYSPDRVTWTPIGDEIAMPVTTTWNSASIDLSSLAGTRTNYFLGFEVYTTTSTSSIYLDHVFGPEFAAIAPGPPTPTAPADLAVNVSQFPVFTWSAPTTGGVPTGFRVYCDTNANPSTLIGDVAGLTYTATSALAYNTLHYWKVVAYNGTGDSDASTIFSFTTREDPTIYTLPWTEDFGTTGTTFPPTNWSRWSGVIADPSTLVANTTLWVQDDWLNDTTTGNKSARINIYSTSRFGWLITPPIQIPATGYQLEFDIGLTDYANSNPISSDPNGLTGVDDKFIVLIGDGSTWSTANIVRQWDNAGSPYVYNNVPHTGLHVTLPLDAHVGTRYVAFYGESTVSNADNDFFVDNVLVRQTPAGLPDHVTLTSPANESTGLDPDNVMLTWTPALTGGLADYFEVYVGADPIDPGISYFGEYFYETTDPFLDLSGQPDIELGYNTTWYWAVLPQTTGGAPDPDDPAFMVWHFTTAPDPTIMALPHAEYFDGVTAPALPWGWSSYVQATTTAAIVNTLNSSTYAVTLPNSARMFNSTDAAADLMLIAPEFDMPVNTIKTRFYARGSTAGQVLLVGTVDTATNTFTQLGSIATTTTQTQYEVPFDAYVGTDAHIAFKHGLGATSRTIYIDNVEFIEMVNNDLAALSLTGPGLGAVGVSADYTVTVKNEGLLTQNSYTVKLMSVDTRTELASLLVTDPIAPGATAQHVLSWSPTAAGTENIYGKAVLAGDATPANDDTPTKSVFVVGATTEFIGVGDPETTTKGNYLPLTMYYKNSVSESMYFYDEMHLISGAISAITYQNNFVQDLPGKPVKIWMGTTTLTDLTGGWLPADTYTLVFDGTIDFPLGINEVVVPLQTPFNYTGGNLLVRVNRPMDTAFFNTSNHFYYTTTPDYPSRSRYLYSDSVTYDPLAPSAAGTLLGYNANTTFLVDNAVMATGADLEGYVYLAGSDPLEPIAGATVTLTDERYTTTTDANGFYSFRFWENLTVTATASMAAHYSQTVTGLALTMGNTVTQNFQLTAQPRVTVSGVITASDAPAGMEGAAISLTGIENHSTTSGPGGVFSIPDVLGHIDGLAYTLTVSMDRYEADVSARTVYETNLNVGTINLIEIAWPVYDVVATEVNLGRQLAVELVWEEAGPPEFYFSDFEVDNGGWVPSSNWANPLGDWEWTDSYNVANYVVGGYPASEVPPPTAYSGDGLWGTIINAPYTNSGGFSYLTQTLDFSGYTDSSLKFWSWNNLYGSFDYGQIRVNGTLVWGPSLSVNNSWQEVVIDLSAYDGLAEVTIQFEAWATTVVNYAGWYIDDVYVGPATRMTTGQFSLSPSQNRVLTGYDVYRFPIAEEANPTNWTQVATGVMNPTYMDNGWQGVATGDYKWAVVAAYSANLYSDPELSNLLTRYPDTMDPIGNLSVALVGADVVLSWDAVTGATAYKVYASDDPYGLSWTYMGLATNPTHTIVAPTADYKFYYVTAVGGEMPDPPTRSGLSPSKSK